MHKPKGVTLIKDKQDFFVVVDGVTVARHGHPGTPQAGTWVSLEPGWQVFDSEGLETIAIEYSGATIH
jgi:hypothetical protein